MKYEKIAQAAIPRATQEQWLRGQELQSAQNHLLLQKGTQLPLVVLWREKKAKEHLLKALSL